MKAPSLSLLGTVACLAARAFGERCHGNSCARAVTGTRRGEAFVTSARSDCSDFMTSTIYGATETVTVNTPVFPESKVVPLYASACDGSSRYSSACSCWGITTGTLSKETDVNAVLSKLQTSVTFARLTNVRTQTTTVTVSASGSTDTLTSTTAETTTSTSTTSDTSSAATPTGSGYTPNNPASYADCVFDPAKGLPFQLLTPNALAIINKDGKAVEASSPMAVVDPMTFSKPAGAPEGVYDIVITAGGKVVYMAIFASGAVGFVDASSNGQVYVGTGDQYITTVWSINCDGLTHAGIIGGDAINFVVEDNGDITANFLPSARIKRSIPVPGFYTLPRDTPTPPGSKCPSPVQHATTKNPPVPQTSNGCGPEGFWGYFVPNYAFVDACNFHDVCWSDCSATFDGCNTEFLNRMNAKCDALFPGGFQPPVDPEGIDPYAQCLSIAAFYHYMVSSGSGASHYTETVQEYCDCVCDDTSLAACQDQCVDLLNDPNNCGDCNFKCPTGKCTNGACAFNSCTGSTCDNFGSCGPGGSCVCASITDNTGFCVDGSTPCAGLVTCGTSADCVLGSVCAVGTCCGQNVCITTDVCGGYNLPGRRDLADVLGLRGGHWTNATVGHLAEWVP